MKTNLRIIRTDQGLSLKALVKRVEVSAHTLSAIEAESSSPSLKLLIKIA